MESVNTLYNTIAVLVIVGFIVWLAVIASDMRNDEWPADYFSRRRKEKRETKKVASQAKTKTQRENGCDHSYYEMTSKQRLIETEDFLFAYHFLDNNALGFKKINEEKDIQKRPVPNNSQLVRVSRYYCPNCKRMEAFRLDDICNMAIDARKTIEEEDAKKEIERKWRET